MKGSTVFTLIASLIVGYLISGPINDWRQEIGEEAKAHALANFEVYEKTPSSIFETLERYAQHKEVSLKKVDFPRGSLKVPEKYRDALCTNNASCSYYTVLNREGQDIGISFYHSKVDAYNYLVRVGSCEWHDSYNWVEYDEFLEELKSFVDEASNHRGELSTPKDAAGIIFGQPDVTSDTVPSYDDQI